MWIRTYIGQYVNSDQCTAFFVVSSKANAGAVIMTSVIDDPRPTTVAQFNTKEEAQLYLDKMIKAFGKRVFEVNMADWNYSGHKKDLDTPHA